MMKRLTVESGCKSRSRSCCGHVPQRPGRDVFISNPSPFATFDNELPSF